MKRKITKLLYLFIACIILTACGKTKNYEIKSKIVVDEYFAESYDYNKYPKIKEFISKLESSLLDYNVHIKSIDFHVESSSGVKYKACAFDLDDGSSISVRFNDDQKPVRIHLFYYSISKQSPGKDYKRAFAGLLNFNYFGFSKSEIDEINDISNDVFVNKNFTVEVKNSYSFEFNIIDERYNN